MPKEILNQPISTKLINEDGTPTSEFFTLIELLTRLEIDDGDSSPEGVVFAKFKSLFWDNVGSKLYLKTTAESLNTGWVAIN